MALKVSLRARQRLALTPGMQDALRILRLPSPDLVAEIAREAGENPFLDLGRSGVGLSSAYDVALDTVAARPSLGEALRGQIGAMVLPVPLRALADYLTGELRDDGYLDTPLQEIAGFLHQPIARLEEALAVLQRCEPTGVGARTLAECLALQLGDHGLPRALADAVVARLPLFAQHRLAQLQVELGLPLAELSRISAVLRELKPRPVPPEPETLPPPLLPDLIVERLPSGALGVRLGREALPWVSLDRGLVARTRDAADPFVAERRARAQALLRALRARGRTLLKIGQRLLHDQAHFFAHGPEHMAPMRRHEMAAALGLHPSTLGRAVAGKAILVDGALYPLAAFFSPALAGPQGVSVSAHSVRIAIRRMIDAEPAGRPLSDAAICRTLLDDGVDISRRTVAKYRQCMRIPPSSERRRRRS